MSDDWRGMYDYHRAQAKAFRFRATASRQRATDCRKRRDMYGVQIARERAQEYTKTAADHQQKAREIKALYLTKSPE